jgi:transcriptional regulator with XRE-family HTH domain
VPSAYPKEYKACIAAIIKARKDKGLTQQELADDLGKPQSFVAKYEKSQRRLDVAEFLMIMRAIGFLPPAAIKRVLEKDPTMNIRHRSRRRFFSRRARRPNT